MSYSTVTTILTILPGLPQTAVNGSGYTETVALIEKHVDRADNVINGKIARRYGVGAFNTTGAVPPLLITLSEDIASYYTYRSLFSEDNQNDNEWIDKFNEAMEVLDDIHDAKVDLVNTTGSLITENTEEVNDLVDSTTKGYQSYFDIDSATSWKFDSERVDSVRDRR